MRVLIILLFFTIFLVCKFNANVQNYTYNNYNNNTYPEYPPMRPPRWCQFWEREYGANTYQFYREHQMRYKRGGISLKRWSNYCYNMYRMRRFNGSKFRTWKEGENKFTDVHWKDFLTSHCRTVVPYSLQKKKRMEVQAGIRKPKVVAATTTTTTTTTMSTTGGSPSHLAVESAQPLPKSNWSKYSGEVRNQGDCGDCWAFCVAQILHTICSILHGIFTGASEQNFLDCTYPPSTNANGCNGGWMTDAYDYSLQNNGTASVTSYSYTAQQGTCSTTNKKFNRITGYTQMAFTNAQTMPNTIAQQLNSTGPLAMAMDASNLQSYTGGTYSCPSKTDDSVNHGVACMGIAKCPDSNNMCYLIKNSWGNNWGYNGYFYLSTNATSYNDCGCSLYCSWVAC